jgi:hypothetical protein
MDRGRDRVNESARRERRERGGEEEEGEIKGSQKEGGKE